MLHRGGVACCLGNNLCQSLVKLRVCSESVSQCLKLRPQQTILLITEFQEYFEFLLLAREGVWLTV